MTEKAIYKAKAGTPLLTTISAGCKTPLLEIKFCNLLNPYYFKNSPNVPRYSVTCVVDPDEHQKFMSDTQAIEKNEGVPAIMKEELVSIDDVACFSGKLLVKFQGKDIIPVYKVDEKNNPVRLELEDELERGEFVVVIYDILRYTNKNSDIKHGISFKPTAVFYYPKEG